MEAVASPAGPCGSPGEWTCKGAQLFWNPLKVGDPEIPYHRTSLDMYMGNNFSKGSTSASLLSIYFKSEATYWR